MAGGKPSDSFGDLFSEAQLEEFVRMVHKGAYRDGSYNKERVSAYAELFSKGVVSGYGNDLSAFDFDTPDYRMLESLKNNCFHFSAAKNRSEIQSLSSVLRDANGKLRSFTEFKVEASKILEEYQGAWLKTEYDTAVNSATLAARWTEFNDQDLLVFRTVGDRRVREEHRKLEGIKKPKGDPFWDTYYPPLSWNCRCTVEVVNRGKITPDDHIPGDAIDGVPKMFRTNFAQDGVAFPPDHPYYKIAEGDRVYTHDELKQSRDRVRGYWDNIIEPGASYIFPTKAKHIEQVTLTRKSVKTMTAKPHSDLIFRDEAVMRIEEVMNSAKYVGWAEDEIIDGKKKHPFVDLWQYYEVKINNRKSYLCIQRTINGDFRPYCFDDESSFDRKPSLKKGSPRAVHNR